MAGEGSVSAFAATCAIKLANAAGFGINPPPPVSSPAGRGSGANIPATAAGRGGTVQGAGAKMSVTAAGSGGGCCPGAGDAAVSVSPSPTAPPTASVAAALVGDAGVESAIDIANAC